jgi:hypothetical protein
MADGPAARTLRHYGIHAVWTGPTRVTSLPAMELYSEGVPGGYAFGATNEGAPLGGRPLRGGRGGQFLPSRMRGVLSSMSTEGGGDVHTGTIRLDSASSNRNSPRFTATEHYQPRCAAQRDYNITNSAAPPSATMKSRRPIM